MSIKRLAFFAIMVLLVEETSKPKLIYRDKEQPNYGEK